MTTLSENQATSLLTDASDTAVQPLQFTRIETYTTFAAEYAVSENDLVFHFYVTDEVNDLPRPKTYWLQVFPGALETVSKEFFNADFPRLKAAYTEEKASWWLRAFGFGNTLDPNALAQRFLEKLDAALEGAMRSDA